MATQLTVPTQDVANPYIGGIIAVFVVLGVAEIRNLDTRWRWIAVVFISAFVAVAIDGFIGAGEAFRSYLSGVAIRNGYGELVAGSVIAFVLVVILVAIIVSQEKQLRRGDKPGRWAFLPIFIVSVLLCTFSSVAIIVNQLALWATQGLLWLLGLG